MLFLKAFSWETNLWVTLGDFLVRKIDSVDTKCGVQVNIPTCHFSERFLFRTVFCLAWTYVRKRLSNPNVCAACDVRRPPSAVHGFLSGAYLGNRMTHLDDIWYVGGSRSEVAHAEFWAWQMPIKYLICIIYAKICLEHFSGTVCTTWMVFGMWVGLGPKMRMVTLMEVKGHQRSNGVNYVLWLPYLVKRSPDASWEWWWPWWRSKVIRGQMG